MYYDNSALRLFMYRQKGSSLKKNNVPTKEHLTHKLNDMTRLNQEKAQLVNWSYPIAHWSGNIVIWLVIGAQDSPAQL